MERPKYHIDIFWSDEDEGYIANVPDLDYCSAFGESYEEALAEVLASMDLHLDTLRKADRPIPEPQSRRTTVDVFDPEARIRLFEGVSIEFKGALEAADEALTLMKELQDKEAHETDRPEPRIQ